MSANAFVTVRTYHPDYKRGWLRLTIAVPAKVLAKVRGHYFAHEGVYYDICSLLWGESSPTLSLPGAFIVKRERV